MQSHSFLVDKSGSPYHSPLFPAYTADGPTHFTPLLTRSDLVKGNETSTPGSLTFASDQGAGKLAVPNPLYHVPGAPLVAAHYGEGMGWHQDVHYRNRLRKIRDQLQNHTTHVRFDGRLHNRTPIALPNIIPVFYFN